MIVLYRARVSSTIAVKEAAMASLDARKGAIFFFALVVLQAWYACCTVSLSALLI